MRRSLLIVICGCLTACTADDEVQRGDVGEFCNGRDSDCRTGLVCDNSVCVEPGPQPIYDCADICSRLAECEAREGTCQSDCRISTTDWELRARNEFGVCMVEDLTCAEALANDPPQLCYSRIEVPTARRARCDSFVDFARECGAPTSTLEQVLEGCVAVARVSREVRWDDTAQCASQLETGICSQVATCFNEVLELSSPVSL